jgi:hypothetical protein
MPLDSRLGELIAALDDSRRTLADAVASIPAARHQERPAPDRWSVAEILEHCARVEEGSTRLIAALVVAAPARPAVDEAAGATGTAAAAHTVSRAVFTNRTVRVPAPAFLHPSGAVDAEAAWARLEAARAALLAEVHAADGRALEAVTRPHPVLGPLNGYQWISAVAGHECRHALQVREAGEALAAAA